MKFIFVVVFTAIAVGLVNGYGGILGMKQRGFPNVHCPQEPNSKLLVPCELDCIHQHGARGGFCGDPRREDFNCYCEKEASPTVYQESLQCVRPEERYEELCNLDCQCNHGARWGKCNYERKACVCEGLINRNNINCPFDDFKGFSRHIFKLLGSGGLGKYSKFFVNGEFHW